MMLGGSVFQLRWDGQNIIPNVTTIGWGFSFSGREYFGIRNFFRWMASYGQGWGSQIVATIGTGSSGILTPQGELETMPAWNLGAGFAFNLADNLVANLNTNWYSINPSQLRDQSKMKSGGTGHLNLIYSPYKKLNVGVEYMMLKRINGDDSSGVGRRMQMMIKYLF